MTYTLSKILVGSIGGSLGLFARGASQKKCASSAHLAPPSFFAFSIIALTLSESGLAGAGAGGCEYNKPVATIVDAIAFFIRSTLICTRLSEPLRPRDRGRVY